MEIRPERATDVEAIGTLNQLAFGTPLEATLVDALRREATGLVSLVAEDNGVIVGHILFSPVTLAPVTGPGINLALAGLGPMAVTPLRQRAGIGSALVQRGLDRCRQHGYAAVVVLGHPEFYPRFGFVPASRFRLTCEYDVPDEVFMALELVAGALPQTGGMIRYHPAFGRSGA